MSRPGADAPVRKTSARAAGRQRPGLAGRAEDHGRQVQAAQLPAANGIGSAHGLARVFAAVIGEVDGVRLMPAAVLAEARREQVRGPDLAAAAMTESALGLEFNLPTADRPLGGPLEQQATSGDILAGATLILVVASKS